MLDRVPPSDRLLDIARGFAPALPSSVAAARDASLSEAGLTSMGAVRLMLAVEAAFDIALPEAELTPANFATIRAIEAMLARLRAA
jgi:acyl carrier protein